MGNSFNVPIAYSLLPTAYSLLPTAYCLLPIAFTWILANFLLIPLVLAFGTCPSTKLCFAAPSQFVDFIDGTSQLFLWGIFSSQNAAL